MSDSFDLPQLLNPYECAETLAAVEKVCAGARDIVARRGNVLVIVRQVVGSCRVVADRYPALWEMLRDFIAVDSETDGLPIGIDFPMTPEYRKHVTDEMQRALELYGPGMIETCERLLPPLESIHVSLQRHLEQLMTGWHPDQRAQLLRSYSLPED
jgi:hypothetical protein